MQLARRNRAELEISEKEKELTRRKEELRAIVEYWGLMNEEWYRKVREVKERQYRQAHLDLRSIEPEDMRNLDEILRYKFMDILERR